MKRSAALVSLISTVLTLCVFTFLFEPFGEAAPIRSYNVMEHYPDIITMYPDPYLAPSDLAVYGIEKEVWHNPLNQWVTGYDSAVSNFSLPDLSSHIAPFGDSINDAAMRLTFSTPIYAFGATLIATQFPDVDNPADSFDNNEQNVSYQLTAYDLDGNEIGSVYSSSYGAIIGPVEYHTTFKGTEFMASYAGIRTQVPIHQLIVIGERSDGPFVSAVGSFSFSFTRVPEVPEPATMLLLGSGLLGLWGARKKFRK